MDKSSQRWIRVIIILAVAIRVGLFIFACLNPNHVYTTDSGSYLSPAFAMLETGSYSYPGATRMPLYPVLIALVYAISGVQPIVLILVQVILGLSTVYITYRIGILLGLSSIASTLGALILSLSLESLISPFFVLTDTLFTFLLILTTFVFILFLKRGRLIWLVASSLLTGMVTLCRPIALVFAAVGVVILLINRRPVLWKRFVHVVVYIGLLFALFVVPWSIRNERVVGVRTLTTESGLYWLWAAATLDADDNHITVDQAYDELYQQIRDTMSERGLQSTEANEYALFNEIPRKMVLDNLGQFVILTIRYDLRVFLPGIGYAVKFLGMSQGSTEGLEVIQSQGIQGVIANYFSGQMLSSIIFFPFVVLLGITYVGVIIGVVDLVRKREWLTLAILVITAGYFILLPGYSANSRYRVPAMPYLALLAGAGLTVLWEFLRKKTPHKDKKTLPG